MSLKRRFRNLIIGKNQLIENRNEFKKTMLVGQICLVTIGSCAVYWLSDFVTNSTTYLDTLIYCLISIIALINLLLVRRKKLFLSTFVIMVGVNVYAFLFADNDSSVAIFFIPIAIAPFSLFDFAEKKLAFSFAFTSFLLLSSALTFNFSFTPAAPPQELENIYLFINFWLCFAASILSVNTLLNKYHYSETVLIDTNNQLRKTNFELDTLIYRSSHDLRGPVASIQGLASLATMVETKEELKELLTHIRERINHQEKHINDIADFSLNKRSELMPEVIALKDFISQLLQTHFSAQMSTSASVITQIDDAAKLSTDKHRLEIVLRCIISNAFIFRDPDKKKLLIEIKVTATRHEVNFSIQDNGTGIDLHHQQQIFNMYFRASEDLQGLGLYIAKETITKMGGAISFTSIAGEGSCFVFSVPINATSKNLHSITE
jgi:signal transduction histidine kinase